MRRRILSISIILLMIFLYSILGIAASGTAHVYYNSSLSVGTTSAINGMLSNIGYSASRSANPTVSTLKSSLSSAKLVHVLSHGSAGSTVCSNGSLAQTDIGSTSNLKFAFMETCNSGTAAANGKSTAGTIKSNGATAVIGFDSTISAGTSSDGCHYFAHVFYSGACNSGYTVTQAASSALSQLYSRYGSYYGCQYYVVFGGNNRID